MQKEQIILSYLNRIKRETNDPNIIGFIDNRLIGLNRFTFYTSQLYLYCLTIRGLRIVFGRYGLNIRATDDLMQYAVDLNGHKNPLKIDLLPCRIPDTNNGCQHYDQCYHGATCPAARRSWVGNPNARRVCGVYYGSNTVHKPAGAIKGSGASNA